MKNFMMICAAFLIMGLASSCSKDKCLTCTYTDAAGATVSTNAGEAICAGSLALDVAEAAAQSEADFAGGTNLTCTRD